MKKTTTKAFLKISNNQVNYNWRAGSSVLSGKFILEFLNSHQDLMRGRLFDLGCGEPTIWLTL